MGVRLPNRNVIKRTSLHNGEVNTQFNKCSNKSNRIELNLVKLCTKTNDQVYLNNMFFRLTQCFSAHISGFFKVNELHVMWADAKFKGFVFILVTILLGVLMFLRGGECSVAPLFLSFHQSPAGITADLLLNVLHYKPIMLPIIHVFHSKTSTTVPLVVLCWTISFS